jgi:AcrR family transcriptional regulator
MASQQARRRRPGGQMDPEADRLILETAKRLMREQGYERLTMDGVAKQAGVARTTVYRRYRDKAELVSAAIDSLRDPSKRPDSGDARRDLVAHVENMRRNFDMSLAGTLLMEEPHNPRLIALFRERMVLPRRKIIRDSIEKGIDRGQIRPDLDIERILDYLVGVLFAAFLTQGKPDPEWSERTIDAIWHALSNESQPRADSASKRRK